MEFTAYNPKNNNLKWEICSRATAKANLIQNHIFPFLYSNGGKGFGFTLNPIRFFPANSVTSD